jgi:hypothetical protein
VTENAQHGIELERAKSEDHRRIQLPRFRAYFHATRWLKPSYLHHSLLSGSPRELDKQSGNKSKIRADREIGKPLQMSPYSAISPMPNTIS